MKKVLILICLVAVSFVFLNPIYAAQGGKGAAPQIPAKRPVPADRAIAFLAGSISKIDTTVPTNVKI